jgi:hypothetical protein
VDAEPSGEIADALHRGIFALAHDVGRAELFSERDAIGMASEHDDLLGTEALRGDYAAQTDGAVADNRHFLTGRRP